MPKLIYSRTITETLTFDAERGSVGLFIDAFLNEHPGVNEIIISDLSELAEELLQEKIRVPAVGLQVFTPEEIAAAASEPVSRTKVLETGEQTVVERYRQGVPVPVSEEPTPSRRVNPGEIQRDPRRPAARRQRAKG